MTTNTDKTKQTAPVTHFHTNLKFLRLIQGLSQAGLAKAVGLSRSNIASYESGLVEPKTERFLKICHYFQVQPHDMLTSLMSEQIVDKVATSPKANAEDLFVASQIKDFVRQTSEITKVLEGYKAFFDMESQVSNADSPQLAATLQDVFALFNALVQSNWSLIRTVLPAQEEEE